MSVRNTPLNMRLNKIAGHSLTKDKDSSTSTPNSLRKISRTTPAALLRKSSCTFVETPTATDKSGNDSGLFNNAFSLPVSASKTPSSKLRPKPNTILNACYTPSSLYRPTNLKSATKSVPATPRSASDLKRIPKTPDGSALRKELLRRSDKSAGHTADDGVMSRSVKEGEISNLTVAVRVRPLNALECMNPSATNIVQVRGNEITINAGTTADNSAGVSHCFQYDAAFYSANPDSETFADQEDVFRGTGLPLIDKAFEGYNACLFAYGQTGSGKSYSMMGIEVDDSDDFSPNYEAGIIPRFCHELFRRIEASKDTLQAEIEVSYFEIYNEKIHDLLCVTQTENGASLSGAGHRNALKVREHPVWGPYVVDLSTHPVDSYHSLRNWLAVGNSQRATAATGMNDKSSRSHSILNIVLNLSEIGESPVDGQQMKQTRRSKISLVDLAGSERIVHTGTNGERMREGVSINKSLLTLGKVIAALAESKKSGSFVPYRESVLTWLLRESLGGNSRTVMLATISPASMHLDETLATLRYACQARTIVNRVKVNEDRHDKIIRELRAEVERLQALRHDYERQKRLSANGNNVPPRKIIIETSVDETEVEALRQQLADTERELVKAQKSWMDRLKEAEDLRKSELRMLKRKGLAMELSVEQKQACLVNLAADPLLSGTLFYILPPGTVQIGRNRPSAFSQPDIILEGPLVAFHHCSIENINGALFITSPNDDFETYLNGELVTERRQLFHSDRLVIGGSHYFRISNPACSRNKSSNKVVDFQLAHEEILEKQEQQLRTQLDAEKRAALTQIELERAANERHYKENMDMLELERFKFKCSKELLETEKRELEKSTEKFEYTPYKSTLLDDIKRIMENPTEESLHKTQLMVKEATQRCRNLGVPYDFKQSQMLDEFGIFRAVVLIIDRNHLRKAEWPTARLEVWLDIVRDNDVTASDLFKSVDIEWEPIDENAMDETLNDSLNSSKISLNLSLVKEAFSLEKNLRASVGGNSQKRENLTKSAVLNSTKCKNTKKMLTYEDEENSDFNMTASGHVRDIQRTTLKLKRLCDRHRNENSSKYLTADHVKTAIEQIESILSGLQTRLHEDAAPKATSPTKTPKIVRFFLD